MQSGKTMCDRQGLSGQRDASGTVSQCVTEMSEAVGEGHDWPVIDHVPFEPA